jgi:ABC-2 type transport system permease protein
VAVLPGWLQKTAKVIPLTYSLEGMRMALLSGKGIGSLRTEFLALVVFTVVSLVVGIAAARFAIGRARRDGTLGQY